MTQAEPINHQEQGKTNTYVEFAPAPTDPAIIPSIYSIELRKDQRVEWLWTQLPDGNQVVTGYKLT
jgi:hypothetical protein